MQLTTRKESEIVVIRVIEQRIDISGVADFREKIEKIIAEGNKRLVLNLSDVEFIDSRGLGAIIAAFKQLREDGELAIVKQRSRCCICFDLPGLTESSKFLHGKKTLSPNSVADILTQTNCYTMEYQKITITIESRIENVSLVGMVIGKLCSSIPLSKMDAYLIEVCAVEAVTNSIIHAYGNAPDNHVEIVFSFDTAGITLEVCDTGTSMDPKILDEIKASSLEVSPDDIASIIRRGGEAL